MCSSCHWRQISSTAGKRPFIFYEVGGAGGIWGGSPKKKTALKGGHLKKVREKGGHVKYFSSAKMEYVLLFLKNMSPQKQTKKVLKSIRDVPSAFNNVSTARDYNFNATEINK